MQFSLSYLERKCHAVPVSRHRRRSDSGSSGRSIDHLRDVQSPTPNSRQNRRQARNLQPSPDLQTYRLKPAFCSWLHSRSEEHTSELQSLMRISYAVFCLTQKKKTTT